MKPIVLAAALGLIAVPLLASSARDTIIDVYATQAGAALDAARGQALFMATHSGGKPDTPSCTSCHSADPFATGQTRAGKAIEPMAVSANPVRFTDPEEVEKWFGRNCNSVLGRDCTALEKGDVLIWLNSL